jgi:hypothetical protein
MAPAPASTSAAADQYNSASYPSLWEATKAPPAYWPAGRNSTDGQRACVAFPNYYMVQCCGQAGRSASSDGTNSAIHDPKCGWEVCISTTTDEQWDECFKQLDAQRGNVADKGYSYNCAVEKKSKKDDKKDDKEKSGARRAVVGAALFAAACAGLTIAL